MLGFRRSLAAYAGIGSAILAILIATAPAAAETNQIQQPTAEINIEPEPPLPPPLTPKEYLYATYPEEAPLMDRIISCESGWRPEAKNGSSSASGLAQFISSTWVSSRTRMGLDASLSLRFDPIENIDTAVWLLRKEGPTHWECFTLRMI